MKVLEIGPGTKDGKSINFEGAITLDPGCPKADFNSDWGQEPLPFKSDSFDLVFASHVLEHIPWYRTNYALSEVFRVLRKGGEVEIYVPDFSYIVACYKHKMCGDHWRVFNEDADFMTWVNGRLFTYGPDAKELISEKRPILGTHHKAAFDSPYLVKKLAEVGFSSVKALSTRRNGKAHSVVEAGALGVK